MAAEKALNVDALPTLGSIKLRFVLALLFEIVNKLEGLKVVSVDNGHFGIMVLDLQLRP